MRNKTLLLIILLTINTSLSLKNPSAVYCEELGYDYKDGYCYVSEKIRFDSWDFFKGKVGQGYSYCSKKGLSTQTLSDGKNPFSKEYAVCVDNKEKKPVTEMMKIENKARDLPEQTTSSPIKNSHPVSSGSPPSFDWRDHNNSNWVTPVKDQGSCGSCWAFSSIGVVEAKINIERNDSNLDVNLSEQELVSCDHWCWPGTPNCSNGCNGGYMTGSIEYYIPNNGVADSSCAPYLESNGDCSDYSSCTDKWFTDSGGHLGASPSSELVKDYLISRGPLSIGFFIGGAYWDGDVMRCSTNTGAHAVVLVGYNDSEGVWIMKNSWDDTWGDNGFFKLGYGECGVFSYNNGPLYAEYTPSPCNTSPACSLGTGDDNYGAGGEFSCLGYKDALSNCDYADNCTYSTDCDTDDDDDGVLDVNDDCPLINGVAYHNGCPDNYPPELNYLEYPNPGTGLIILNWSFLDYCVLDNNITLEYYDEAWSSLGTGLNNNDSYSWNSSTINSNNIKLRVNATDDYNNLLSVLTSSFRVDNTPPEVNLISPYHNHKTSNETYFLKFNSTDNLASTLNCSLLLNGSKFPTDEVISNGSEGEFSFNIGPDSVFEWMVNCSDGVINSNSDSWSFIKDTTPPNLMIKSPVNTTYNDTQVIINLSNSDELVGVSSVWYSFNSDNASPYNTSPQSYFNTSLLGHGSHLIKAYANDTLGNQNNATLGFTIDLLPPEINVLSPEPKNYSTNNIWFNMSLNELVNISTISIDNGSPFNLTKLNSTHYYNNSLISEGTHQALFNAADIVNNTNSTIINFLVSIKPVINNLAINKLILPGELNNITAELIEENTNQVWADITMPDKFSETVNLINNSLSNYPSDDNWYYELSNTSLTGTYNLSVFVNDSLGNKANQSTSFRVSEPVNLSLSSSNNLTIKVYYQDEDSIRAEAVNNSNITLPSGSWDLKFQGDEVVINLRSVNLSNNLIDNISLQENASFSQPSDFIIHKVSSFTTSLTFNNASIIIPFNTTSINNHVRVMKCDDWNILVNDCDSDWVNITSDALINNNQVIINTSSFSAFSIIENCDVSCGSWSSCTSESQSRTCTRANCETYTETRDCLEEDINDDEEEDEEVNEENYEFIEVISEEEILNNSYRIRQNLSLIEGQLSILNDFLKINASRTVNDLINNLSVTLSSIEDNNTLLNDKASLLDEASLSLNNLSLAVPEVTVLEESSTIINQSSNDPKMIESFTNRTGATVKVKDNMSLNKSFKKIMVKDKNTNHTSHYILVKNELTNPFNHSLHNISLVESIPKSYAASVNDILFHDNENLVVIEEDPVIAWHYDTLSINETVTNRYVIPKNISEGADLINNSVLSSSYLSNNISVNNESAVRNNKEPVNWLLIVLVLIGSIPATFIYQRKMKQLRLKRLIKNK
ncbi:hypothetical protein GF352_04490 [archaeon]|nr:hypothetical protein [archaeon]